MSIVLAASSEVPIKASDAGCAEFHKAPPVDGTPGPDFCGEGSTPRTRELWIRCTYHQPHRARGPRRLRTSRAPSLPANLQTPRFPPPNVRHERRAKGREGSLWDVRSMEGLGVIARKLLGHCSTPSTHSHHYRHTPGSSNHELSSPASANLSARCSTSSMSRCTSASVHAVDIGWPIAFLNCLRTKTSSVHKPIQR